jgi:hypothetical protein
LCLSEGSDSENESNIDAEEDKIENVLGWKRLSLVASDMKRGDIWKACYDMTVVPWFWILCTILLVSEPWHYRPIITRFPNIPSLHIRRY